MTKVARINRLFGTDGTVMVTLYRDFPDDFTADTPLFVEIDSLEVPLYCSVMEYRSTNGALMRFEDIDTPQRAGELLHRELYVHDAGEVSGDEFRLEDLIGFAVEASVQGSGGLISGRISDFYDSDANPLLGILFEGRDGETLVPAAGEFIAGIDFGGRSIRLVLPGGLLDL